MTRPSCLNLLEARSKSSSVESGEAPREVSAVWGSEVSGPGVDREPAVAIAIIIGDDVLDTDDSTDFMETRIALSSSLAFDRRLLF